MGEVNENWTKAVIPIAILILTGVAVRIVSGGEYGAPSVTVWLTGFGFSVLYVWYTWIRPIDFTDNS